MKIFSLFASMSMCVLMMTIQAQPNNHHYRGMIISLSIPCVDSKRHSVIKFNRTGAHNYIEMIAIDAREFIIHTDPSYKNIRRRHFWNRPIYYYITKRHLRWFGWLKCESNRIPSKARTIRILIFQQCIYSRLWLTHFFNNLLCYIIFNKPKWAESPSLSNHIKCYSYNCHISPLLSEDLSTQQIHYRSCSS